MSDYPKTPRNQVKRVPKRGHYDRETIFGILDAGFLAHVGFVINDQPFVIPTAYGREGEIIYLHGASKSRMLLNVKKGIPVCLTVTIIDGLVLARSSFHHSMNYRSAVIFGEAYEVLKDDKRHALQVISENILKGRWEEARKPNQKELEATTVLALKIDQASAKIRTGPPVDEKSDYDTPIWAGVLPMEVRTLNPVPDPELNENIPFPASVNQFL